MVIRVNEKIDLKELEQKTYNEFLIDGITEILLGLMLLFFPVMYMNPVFVAFIPFYVFIVAPQILEKIRQRTTYPRIGRVEFKEVEDFSNIYFKKSLLEVLLLLVCAVIITFLAMIIFEGKILEMDQWYSWVPLLFGLIMFGPSVFLVEKTGKKNYYSFVIFCSLLGLTISILDFPNVFDGVYLYFLVLGIFILLYGIIKYFRFIQTYPVIDIEEE
jgi:hypothetical protein